MMEKSSFFNAELVGESYDRTYLAEDYAEYFSSFIGNGVFPNPSTNLQIIADGTSMNVFLKKGKAWINGYFYYNTDDLILPIQPADGVLNRLDRVVLRLDFLKREIKCYIKKGNFTSTPTAPSLQRDADMYELGIADIKVNKGVIKITQADITDLRQNSNYCGIVHGTVEQIDVTTLFNQYSRALELKEQGFEQEFQTWFSNIKGQLSGDVAGNLAVQINEVKSSLGERTTILTASGTANAVTLPITLLDKTKYSFKSVSNSTGAVTINGIALKKIDGTAISNIKANKVYDIYYDQSQNCVFILAKAEGDATVADVLAGKVFSNGNDVGLVGTATIASLGGKRWASGALQTNSNIITVSGLLFKPNIIIIEDPAANSSTSTAIYIGNREYNPIKYDTSNAWVALKSSDYVNSNGFQLTLNNIKQWNWYVVE